MVDPLIKDPESLDVASEDLRDYLQQKHIWELLRYLLIQTFINKPAHPRDFVVELVEHLLEFRESLPSGHVQPRLLWDRCHVVAVFKALDPQQAEVISVAQYHVGMRMLHLSEYNKEPPTTEDGLVTMDTFVDEAYRRLLNEFLAMIDCLPDERNICGCKDQICPCTMAPETSEVEAPKETKPWAGPTTVPHNASLVARLKGHHTPIAPWTAPQKTSVAGLLEDHHAA